MKNDEGLDFALSRTTGRMVDITMVERGLACDCICQHCGAILQARKGRKNRHHFAHNVAGHGAATCEGGVESALHAAARQLISDWRSIELPALLVNEGRRQTSLPGRMLGVLRSELPDDLGGGAYWGRDSVRPDVVLHAETEQIWCEVKVTHAVGDQKRSRLQRYNVATLEFDLSAIYRDGGWTLATLEHALRSDGRIRQWAFHPDEERLRQELKAENRIVEAQRRRVAEALRAGSERGEAIPQLGSEEDAARAGLNRFDGGALVFHPALGLIPMDPAKRLDFIARAYPEPKVYRLASAVAFLRHHPHADGTCLVTFGGIGAGGRTSEYDAALSEFARSARLSCVYFGIPESRQVRGPHCYPQLDDFLSALQADEAAGERRPLLPTKDEK